MEPRNQYALYKAGNPNDGKGACVGIVRLFGRKKASQPPPQPIRSPGLTGAYNIKVITELEVQVEKLKRISQRLTSRGRELFEKCVRAQQQRDSVAASMYAAEVAEMRKSSSVIIRGELSLERVVLRLRSIIDFKQAIDSVGPAIKVIEQVQSDLRGVAPEVSANLASLNDMLDDVMVSAGSMPGGFAETTVIDQEAQGILKEASSIAEQRVKSSFPDMQQLYPSWETGR